MKTFITICTNCALGDHNCSDPKCFCPHPNCIEAKVNIVVEGYKKLEDSLIYFHKQVIEHLTRKSGEPDLYHVECLNERILFLDKEYNKFGDVIRSYKFSNDIHREIDTCKSQTLCEKCVNLDICDEMAKEKRWAREAKEIDEGLVNSGESVSGKVI